MTLVKQAEHRIRHKTLRDVTIMVYDVSGQDIWVMRHGNAPVTSRNLARIQSACLYGHIFLTVDCDCRDQLDQTFDHFRQNGSGLLIYLPAQDGRGAGPIAKARAYEVQDRRGIDMVDAYEFLGLPVDNRDYASAADVLRDLSVYRLRLLTNNPQKVAALHNAGFEVEREPLLARET